MRGVFLACVVALVVAFHTVRREKRPTPRTPTPDAPALERGDAGALVAGEAWAERRAVPVLSLPPLSGEGCAGEDARLGLVQARFLDLEHRPLANVELRESGSSESLGKSDARGRISTLVEIGAEPREFVFEARAPGLALDRRRVLEEGGRPFWLGDWVLAPGGEVRGRVMAEGGPVAGARVRVARMLPASGFPGAVVPKSDGWRETRSNEEGDFRLDGVATGSFWILASKDGRRGQSPPCMLEPSDVLRNIEVRLAHLPFPRLDIEVRDPSGRRVPHAPVRVDTCERRHMDRADGEGRFFLELQPQESEVTLRAHDPRARYRIAFYRGQRPLGRLTLQLGRETWRELRVRSTAGAPIGSYAYELLDAEGIRLAASPGYPRESNETFFAVPDEPYSVRLRSTGFQTFSSVLFEPDRLGALECRLKDGGWVVGTVTCGGLPAAGARVALHAVPELPLRCNGFPLRYHPQPEEETRSDDRGRFVLGVGRRGAFHLVTYDSHGHGFSRGPLLLAPEESLVIDPALEEHGRLRVRVMDGRPGRELAGRVVAVSRGDGGVRTRRSDPSGLLTFEELRPGDWWVELRSEEVRPGVQHFQPRMEPLEARPAGRACVRILPGKCSELSLDVSARDSNSCSLSGWLRLNGAGAEGWTAHLRARDRERETWNGAGSDCGSRSDCGSGVEVAGGGFRLQSAAPGPRELVLRGPDGQVLLAAVELVPGDRSWVADLRLATWEVPVRRGSRAGSRDFHEWRSKGLRVLHPLDRAGGRVRVPPGAGRLLRFEREEEGSWKPPKVLREIFVPPDGSLGVRGE